jgi:hypothetical protein
MHPHSEIDVEVPIHTPFGAGVADRDLGQPPVGEICRTGRSEIAPMHDVESSPGTRSQAGPRSISYSFEIEACRYTRGSAHVGRQVGIVEVSVMRNRPCGATHR